MSPVSLTAPRALRYPPTNPPNRDLLGQLIGQRADDEKHVRLEALRTAAPCRPAALEPLGCGLAGCDKDGDERQVKFVRGEAAIFVAYLVAFEPITTTGFEPSVNSIVRRSSWWTWVDREGLVRTSTFLIVRPTIFLKVAFTASGVRSRSRVRIVPRLRLANRCAIIVGACVFTWNCIRSWRSWWNCESAHEDW